MCNRPIGWHNADHLRGAGPLGSVPQCPPPLKTGHEHYHWNYHDTESLLHAEASFTTDVIDRV